MRGDTVTATTSFYIESCCNCGVEFAMTTPYREEKKDKGGTFSCPNGHEQHYTDSISVQLRKANQRANEAERDAHHAWSRVDKLSNDIMDEVKTRKRLERRINAGVCPHCGRSFKQVSRHIANKHPNCVPAPLTVDKAPPTRKRARKSTAGADVAAKAG